ncbi:hypothetical protein FRC09_005338 [Ceratobasidium sp. 395]|nr:hypothetical protein FRC09_005338 [Ceratobasidium sp. 395]
MLFTLFRLDRTNFISSQLYYDTQASIKNAFFCVVKTKVLDPDQPFYLIQTGDDRLENRFGIYRTASSDQNVDLLQLAERSAAAQQIDNILTENPDYDRTPYRISLKGESGVDHLNPSSWVGDVCVRNVDLQACWDHGRALAEEALHCAGVAPNFDPDSLCALSGGLEVDLMRPLGQYVGVSESEAQEESLASEPGLASEGSAPLANAPNLASTPHISAQNTIGDASLGALDEAMTNFYDAELDARSGEEILFEELLPPCELTDQDNTPPSNDNPVKRGWVNAEPNWVRIESATRIILGTESKQKSTDRLRRVCGFTRYPSTIAQSDSMLGDLCLIGQIILALVRVGDEISLAAVRVTSIKAGGTNTQIESISLDHLNRSDVTLSGQILELEYDDSVWFWNQHFVTASLKGGKGNAAKYGSGTKPLLVQLQASVIELVNPTLSEQHGQMVWSFEDHELVAMIDLLWAKSAKDIHKIPIVHPHSNLPYESDEGENRLIHFDASQIVEAMPAERCDNCYLCRSTIPIKQLMRTHVAKHIMAKRLGMKDPLISVVIGDMPCGFCGRTATCKTTMGRGRSVNTIISDCPFADKFSYKPAQKSTRTSPCTNRPILCEYAGCPKFTYVWSYNMRQHIRARHEEEEYNHVVSSGLFQVPSNEVEFLRLDKPYVVPGRKGQTILPPIPITVAKRPVENSTEADPPTSSQDVARITHQAQGSSVASSSNSKRLKTQ